MADAQKVAAELLYCAWEQTVGLWVVVIASSLDRPDQAYQELDLAFRKMARQVTASQVDEADSLHEALQRKTEE